MPLKKFKLDSHSLTGKGINKDSIERIFRCLFVYSLGFFEMLNSIFKNNPVNNIYYLKIIYKL